MQSNIFAQVAPLLKEKNFDISIDDFVDIMSHYNASEWVYPSVIHRKLQIDIKTVYELLEFLTAKNYLTPYLQIYCPNCKKYTGFYYKTIGEIPSEISCLNCDYEITNPINHAIVVYRVNKV